MRVLHPHPEAPRGNAAAQVPAPSFAIGYLGVLWDTQARQHCTVPGADVPGEHGEVRFRVEGRWAGWQPLIDDGAQVEGQWASALVPAGGAEAHRGRGVPADAGAQRDRAEHHRWSPPR